MTTISLNSHVIDIVLIWRLLWNGWGSVKSWSGNGNFTLLRLAAVMSGFASLLSPIQLSSLIDQWLTEDSTAFDVGGYVAGGDHIRSARLYCKSPGQVILAGVPFFEAVFHRLNCTVHWHSMCLEGSPLPDSGSKKREIATVSGPIASILRGERPALNCISRASGIATTVHKIMEMARQADWKGRIACTRKTTPGFRVVEKYAVMCGGGDPHRYDLGSMIMLKDNHIDACGDMEKAITKAKSVASFSTKIEVETRNIDEALNAARNGADVVMLDNFEPMDANMTAAQLKSTFPHVLVEASGGITLENVTQFFSEDIDVISMGCLTQGYSCIDFSLKVVKE